MAGYALHDGLIFFHHLSRGITALFDLLPGFCRQFGSVDVVHLIHGMKYPLPACIDEHSRALHPEARRLDDHLSRHRLHRLSQREAPYDRPLPRRLLHRLCHPSFFRIGVEHHPAVILLLLVYALPCVDTRIHHLPDRRRRGCRHRINPLRPPRHPAFPGSPRKAYLRGSCFARRGDCISHHFRADLRVPRSHDPIHVLHHRVNLPDDLEFFPRFRPEDRYDARDAHIGGSHLTHVFRRILHLLEKTEDGIPSCHRIARCHPSFSSDYAHRRTAARIQHRHHRCLLSGECPVPLLLWEDRYGSDKEHPRHTGFLNPVHRMGAL